MRRLKHFCLAPAEDPGGEGGAGATGSAEPANPATESSDPAPAAEDPSGSGPTPEEPDGRPAEQKTDPPPRSAFAATEKKDEPKEGEEPGKEGGADAAVDLSKMTDEEWAKAVQPDGENGEVPDRTLMTELAQVSRENGITPKAMQNLVAKFGEVSRQREEARQAIVDRDAEELQKAAVAAFDDDGWKSIHAASAKYVKPGGMLDRALRTTVLGSDLEFLTILKNLGSSLRGDTTPGTATTGSGSSPDHRLFLRTVPAHLR